MEEMPKKIQKTVFVLLIAAGVMALPGVSDGRGMIGVRGPADYAPQVRLISPVGATIDTTGSGGVLFKWSWIEGDRLERRYYDFRIYKGYDMLESTLIFKAQIPPDTDSVFIKADVFKESGVYTWSVRQRYYGLAKSRRSYASFSIIKK